MSNMRRNARTHASAKVWFENKLKSSSGRGLRVSTHSSAAKDADASASGTTVAPGAEPTVGNACNPKVSTAMNTASRPSPSQSTWLLRRAPVRAHNPIASPAKKMIARHACFCIFPLDPSPPSAKAVHRRMLAHSKRPRSRKQGGKDAGKQEGFSPCVRHGVKRRLAVPCLPSSLFPCLLAFCLARRGRPPGIFVTVHSRRV